MRLLLSLLLAVSSLPVLAASQLDKLTLPKGFHIAVYSDQVPNAREIALGAKGTVFVGSNDAGKVYALTDSQGKGVADKVRVIASGLQLPVGVAFRNGDLYVSAVSKIYVLRDIENHLDNPPKPVVVTDKLPTETHHGWKFIAFGPDGKLYVPIGAPCNICDPAPAHGKLTRMNADGSGMEDVARGIRNTVGFDWQPGTGHLWFTDNGRDLMGDDMPSDELNEITRPGEHFGYPYCHQGDTLDPEFGKGKSCKAYVPPVLKLGAHVASLGMRFYEGKLFPPNYTGAIIVAEHGSW
ncbi:MAG: PQQ-dependent sugar dehydrogenase, partial [Lysobacterales bacterium]